jgi:hypothetical protein
MSGDYWLSTMSMTGKAWVVTFGESNISQRSHHQKVPWIVVGGLGNTKKGMCRL